MAPFISRFLRCPAEAFQEAIASARSVCPIATFSEATKARTPADFRRDGKDPTTSCDISPRAAIPFAWNSAARTSAGSDVTGPRPSALRKALTAWAARADSETAAGRFA